MNVSSNVSSSRKVTTNVSDTSFTCDEPWQAQSPNGEIWRSPWEAEAQNSTNPDYFSRDQGLGLLASMTHHVNASWYNPWYSYINQSNGNMCPHEFDCTFEFPFWCTFDLVTRVTGLKRPPYKWMLPNLGEVNICFPMFPYDVLFTHVTKYRCTFSISGLLLNIHFCLTLVIFCLTCSIQEACNNDHLYVLISANVNEKGSALHLTSLDVYIRRMLDGRVGAPSWDETLQQAADVLHQREPVSV